ncbi:MAG: bifunctional adenosylcobinamide kinase/adenosylcobinamide-phosphate guanylyltransferase [Paracoccus sp. (in: a-proteobacteria)]|nr:bifunctional adenosylcobinamide kinase/adenosylcobinamide-phosphate guanylyltransferase [Paracoccus sp. (in: a-proteobacteria)]
MMTHLLITGGAASGKSLYAENRTLAMGAAPAYIATAEARDAEMEARIARHRARRGTLWREHHAPLDLAGALAASDGAPALVDCLTLWLSNLLLAGRDAEAETAALLAALDARAAPSVLVSNEIGLGVVPQNALARQFRDAQGALNQAIAAQADEVVLVVSGLPLQIKPALGA